MKKRPLQIVYHTHSVVKLAQLESKMSTPSVTLSTLKLPVFESCRSQQAHRIYQLRAAPPRRTRKRAYRHPTGREVPIHKLTLFYPGRRRSAPQRRLTPPPAERPRGSLREENAKFPSSSPRFNGLREDRSGFRIKAGTR